MRRSCVVAWYAALVVITLVVAPVGRAQQPASASPDQEPSPATPFFYPTRASNFVPLPDVPPVYDTREHKIRVVTVANGLSFPFSLAFLPDGSLLVTERTGSLRRIANGVLDPEPIKGVPQVVSRSHEGLQDIALHPRFAENSFVYLSYTKGGPDNTTAMALARGRLEGNELKDVEDIYVVERFGEPRASTLASRLVFDHDGYLYMSIGCWVSVSEEAQNPGSALGKVIRLHDDGTIPEDNPFVGREGYLPEIFTLGHRNSLGLAVHPETGDIYQHENGPQGGDELNILKPGGNYGWPVVSQGRDYGGERYRAHEEVPGMEVPFMYWVPAIAPSGLLFYTGEAFPKWKGNGFVGSLAYNHAERLTFNETGEPTYGREWLLIDLKQRIRDIRQGPDGNIYMLTDAAYGALLRVEPAE